MEYLAAWWAARPGRTSVVFHNTLLREIPELRAVLDLFPTPPPAGDGLYNHHDGFRR